MHNSKAMRVNCGHEITVRSTPAKIMPLICPVGELEWIDEWEFDLVYSESGVNENNCIFIEKKSSPFLFETPGDFIWYTTRHDPENLQVHFLIVCDGKAFIKWEVSLNAQEDGLTRVRIDTKLSSLNDEVERIGEDALLERLSVIIKYILESLKHYCETGRILELNEFSA